MHFFFCNIRCGKDYALFRLLYAVMDQIRTFVAKQYMSWIRAFLGVFLLRFDSDMTQISGPKNGGWSLWLWYLTEQLSVPLQTPRSGCFYQSQPTWWRNRTQQRLGHGVGRRWSSPISSAEHEELRLPSQLHWRRLARSNKFFHAGRQQSWQ